MRAEQRSLTRSMPGSPRRRRRKRPRRTAHLRLRAWSGLPPAAGRHRQTQLGALSEPSRSSPGAAAGSGWAGGAGPVCAALSAAAPPESARARRGRVPGAHLGRAFLIPAPPCCSPGPHRHLSDTGAHGRVRPRVSGGAASLGPNPHSSPEPSQASLAQAVPACTTTAAKKG